MLKFLYFHQLNLNNRQSQCMVLLVLVNKTLAIYIMPVYMCKGRHLITAG